MDGHKRGRPHFFMKDGGWFFGHEEGSQIGPFDRILEIVMGECVLGEWKYEQRELTGAALTEALSTMV